MELLGCRIGLELSARLRRHARLATFLCENSGHFIEEKTIFLLYFSVAFFHDLVVLGLGDQMGVEVR